MTSQVRIEIRNSVDGVIDMHVVDTEEQAVSALQMMVGRMARMADGDRILITKEGEDEPDDEDGLKRYSVTKRYDAYADYTVEVYAKSAQDAYDIASHEGFDGKWEGPDLCEMDALLAWEVGAVEDDGDRFDISVG